MMPESSLETTCKRAQDICDNVRSMDVQHHGQSVGTITLSIGVAIFPQDGKTSEQLIQAADQALYRAKVEGRNRVVIAKGPLIDASGSN